MSEPKWNQEKTAQLLDISVQHLGLLKRQGTIPGPVNGEWPALKCNIAYIRFIRDGGTQTAKETKARKNTAEADAAELDAITAARKVCLLSDAKMFWSDERIAIRRTVEQAEYLGETAKRKLLLAFSKLKGKPPEPI